ncbi:hypothetical protein ACT4MK_18255 [Bradyrhizobium barranii]|uniref:hypothetical protein n=1 Tax=Bradyrhizobium barranii TaxID=2992140 RepID=UPI004033439E
MFGFKPLSEFLAELAAFDRAAASAPSLCPCSLSLTGTCSIKRPRARHRRSRRGRGGIARGKCSDPDGGDGPSPIISSRRA